MELPLNTGHCLEHDPKSLEPNEPPQTDDQQRLLRYPVGSTPSRLPRHGAKPIGVHSAVDDRDRFAEMLSHFRRVVPARGHPMVDSARKPAIASKEISA